MARGKKKGESKGASVALGGDERFNSLKSDPRFRIPGKKVRRASIDARFKDALTQDSRFQQKATIDRYGRPIDSEINAQRLAKYYNFTDTGKAPRETARKLDRMRGEGMSDESSSEDSSSEEDNTLTLADAASVNESVAAAEDQSNIPWGEATRRFAAVNLDWDNIRAVDLMVLFSSFAPPNGRVLSVFIYPSKYGKLRMAQESMSGPPRDLFVNEETSKRDTVAVKPKPQKLVLDDEGTDYNSSKLRRYQLQRLQYFYAVVECDSVETANAIYEQCDGSEYESSANFIDLRFIPNSQKFTETPREICSSIPADYTPQSFQTDALQSSRVKLTWDETPRERREAIRRAFADNDAEDGSVNALVASESDDEARRDAQSYRALLKFSDSVSESDEEHEIKMPFKPALDIQTIPMDSPIEHVNSPQPPKEDTRKPKDKSQKTVREAASHGKKIDAKKRAAELELMVMDDNLLKEGPKAGEREAESRICTADRRHLKRSRERDDKAHLEESFDVTDDRFRGLFEDPDFAIDMTAPQFKKTVGMSVVTEERRRRKIRPSEKEPVKGKSG